MFKLESYITPYIISYLEKYFKNFNPANFQFSLLSGANFTNLDLNLEVLENEFNLPVTFVSGHIHELRLNVPWTKITYEPITINVNTIEITLKLKKNDGSGGGSGSDPGKGVPEPCSPKSKLPKEPEEPPGYVQNLINKMITNVRIDCQNVIVKLVEEDIVFTLNVKTASLYPTGPDWMASFIDIIAPEFALRRKLTFSDLTVCLDQTNSAGKIEQYLEPLLYKCSFEIRILQKYYHSFAARPFFTRLDVFSDELKFTITDEQIPMLLRLSNLIIAVKNNIKSSSSHIIEPFMSSNQKGQTQTCDEMAEVLCEDEDDPAMSWASWTLGWIPDISATVFGVVESDDDPSIENDLKPPISLIGFYANKATIVFKGIEAIAEQKNSHGARRVKFQPFLKCSLQGIICDTITRGQDTNLFTGISQILVIGVHTCPCGMKDFVDEKTNDATHGEYLNIGKVNEFFLQNTLFDDKHEMLPPEETVFTYDNHVEVFTEEMMLNRTSAIAIEYLDVAGCDNHPMDNDDESSNHSNSSLDTSIDLARDKLLNRLVIGPSKIKICSGSIHRIKMILFAATLYDYEAADLPASRNSHPEINTMSSFDFSRVKNVESAYDIYQFTIFRPYVEILAGDHLDYDHQTHLRAKYKKRKAATITPLSDVLPEWPKVIVTFSCIDGRVTDPNARFRKLMKKSSSAPRPLLELFTYKLAAKIFTAEVKLRSDQFVAPICIPFNMEFNYCANGRPELWPSRFSQISELNLMLDDFRINLAKPHLMLLQVILVSCYDERMSEHLTTTTILRDLPHYNQGDIVIHVTEFNLQAVFSRILHATELRIGSVGIFLHSVNHPVPIPIFEGPPSNRPDPEGLAVIILQYPLRLLDDVSSSIEEEENESKESLPDEKYANDVTPLVIVNISEFIMQFELIFFQLLSYQPKRMPSSIPPAMQTSSQILHPMIPVSRTSSRMSVISKPQSSWSTSDDNNGSVTGKDFQQLYQSPKPSTHVTSVPESSSINNKRGPLESKENVNTSKPEKMSLEEEFNLRFAPEVYIETWGKWVVANLAVIMKSFIMVNIGAGDIWFPVGQQSFKSFHEEGNHGVLIVSPKVSALAEGPKTAMNFRELHLPVALPPEYKGRELYPLRITLENLILSTVHVTEGKQLFGLPLSVLLTLTLSERKIDGRNSLIAAFLHSDIQSIKLSLSFLQVNLLLRLVEQLLLTVSVLFDSTGNLMLRSMDSNVDMELQNLNSDSHLMETRNRVAESNPNKASTRGSDIIALQHLDNSSQPETEPQNLSESFESIQQSAHVQVENIVQQETKASIWMQVTLAQFQLIIINSFQDKGQSVNQLVFELEDLVSSLDVQSVFVKWSVKIANLSLRNYERTSDDRWDVGKCTGIVISNGEEITKDIKLLKASNSNKRDHALSLSASGNSSPVHGPPKGKQSSTSTGVAGVSKMRGILTFTYTQVQTKNFHKKSEVQSPIARWNAAIKKYCDNHKDSRYDRYDNEDDRYLSEFDLKVGSLDFLFDLTMIYPYMKIFKALSSIKLPNTDEKVIYPSSMPTYSQTKMPLIYLETNLVRFFFKTAPLSSRRVDVPDVLVLQMAAVNIHSQSENPLNRTVVNKELYRMAEHTSILSVPGSPVEDRQYQVDFLEVNIFTCHWKAVKANSRELYPSPTSRMLKTMGENPALEWNTIRSVNAPDEVVAQPILETIDIGIAFAPCIVYEGNMNDPKRHLIIAGHSLEVNAASEVYIYANLHQISAICAIGGDLSDMMNACMYSNDVESKEEVAAFNFYKESDSGIDSVIAFSTSEPVLEEQSEKGSELLSMSRDEGGFKKVIVPSGLKTVPFDFLWTASLFQVMTYDLKHQHKRDKEKLKSEIVGMVPLTLLILGQPHVVLSIGETNQRAELSIFELCAGFAPADRKLATHFSLPDINDFPDRLFECTSGEKNAKTGMTPAFFTAKFTNFYTRPFDFVCDFGRPLKISLCRRIIKNWLRISSYFDTIHWKRTTTWIGNQDKSNNTVTVTLSTSENQSEEVDTVQAMLGKIGNGKITLNQVVLTVIEEAEEDLPRSSVALSLASCELKIRSHVKNMQKGDDHVLVPDNVYVDLQLNGLTLRSGIGARRDTMMIPWNLAMKGKFRWYNCKSWPNTPSFTGSFMTDPISFHIGPQNVLAFIQLHRTFGNYIFDFLAYQEEKLEQIMQVAPGEASVPSEEYEDDLRAGSFRYVYKDNSYDLPEVYQIAFCERHRTMTWRYPHKRCLIRVESFPVPLDSDQANSKTKEIPCIVEYWDEAQDKFCHYGILYLSELSRGSLRCPDKKKLHLFTSTVWRVVIELNDADGINLVNPQLLAASLRVDSLQDPSLNPMFKVYVDIPRISVHFVNQLTYAGKTPDVNLKCYSFGGLSTLPDQPFATIELSMNSLLVSLWALKCKIDFNSYLKFNATEYGYLTNIPVIEPFNFQLFWNLNQPSESENKTHLKLQMSTKPIGVKVSASVLHTITASLITWVQVLENYNGNVVDFTSFQSKRLVHLAETLICNDLNADILLNQVGSGNRRVTENFQCIGGRECFAFVWPTQKAHGLCKISVREPDWKASDVISLKKLGYSVLKIAKSTHKIFVKIEKFSGCQKMVTISGSFSVVNALDEIIEVALLPKFGGREITWPVQSHSPGPSRLIDIENVEHLRFRIVGENSALPWSPVITVDDIKKKRYIFLEMYKEKSGGEIVTYSFWCSYIEEFIENAQRSIIIISPFYRVKSSLPSATTVYNTIGRNQPEEIFQLQGEGSEQQIDFIGSPDVVHHLTFQSSPNVSQSSPPIALLPGGPDLEKPMIFRPIDEIIQSVVESSVVDKNNERQQQTQNQNWPYISDELVIDNWLKCDQVTTDIGMEYTTWIEGLPTVLVDIKPRAIVINLTGQTIFYQSLEEPSNSQYGIPSSSVFTPARIKDPFKLGFESQDERFWTNTLELTEQKSCTDVHYINSNSQIPIDSFSRLEIFGNNEICQITLEARIQRNIITLVLRSTFVIQNKTESWLLVKGISLNHNKIQESSDWLEIPSPQLFYPESKSSKQKIKKTANCSPLLVHYSDHATSQKDDGRNLIQHKYLALSCGGPWWFCQLLKFDLIFKHMPASDGISGRRCVLSVPKFSPASTTVLVNNGSSGHLEDASLPVVLSWCVKNGQVWISISPDQSPQLVLHNLSSKPLFYAQINANSNFPVEETENFDQYLFLPSQSRGYYTFPSSYCNFPKIVSGNQVPSLTIAKLPEKPKGIPKAHADTFVLFHEQNMIYTGEFDWSKPIRVDGPIQSVQIVDILGVKLTVEQLGLSSHIYIENLSNVEISAKDIRHRILGGVQVSSLDQGDLDQPETSKPEDNSFNSSSSYTHKRRNTEESTTIDSMAAAAATTKNNEMTYLPMEYVIYIPWFRVIFLSNVDENGKQHEVLSSSVQDVVLERFTQVEHVKLRALENDELENLVLRLRIGDIQVDTPPFDDKNPDFVVILKRDAEYAPLFSNKNEGVDIFSEQPLKLPKNCTILAEASYKVTSRTTKELQKVYVKFEPVSVFIEKHLIMEVIPVMREIFSSIEQRLPELFTVLTLPAAERFLAVELSHSVPSMWNFENILEPTTSMEHPRLRTNTPLVSTVELAQGLKNLKSQVITLRDDLIQIHEEMSEITHEIELTKEMAKLSEEHLGSQDVENKTVDETEQTTQTAEDQTVSTIKSDVQLVPDDSQEKKSVVVLQATSVHSQHPKDEVVSFLNPPNPFEHNSETLIQRKSIKASVYRSPFLNPPPEVDGLLQEFAEPLRLQQILFDPLTVYFTARITAVFYIAVDRSPIHINEFVRNSILTTHYDLGCDLGNHYFRGIMFRLNNLINGVGSLELVGSPTTWLREVSTGLHDLVVYPYHGIFDGPTGFFIGLGSGFSSLVKHVAAGTVNSVTNSAWSISRNLDRITQDEEDRRSEVVGVTDGIGKGLTSFGVRMLGAVGGIVHYPIQSVINHGPSTSNILTGVGKGMASIITKPIGGAFELVAMTGEGILKGTGWITVNKAKFKPMLDDIEHSCNAPLKYHWRLIREEHEERILLVVDASQPEANGELNPVTLVLTTENLYIFSTSQDELLIQFPLYKLVLMPSEDRNLLCLRLAARKKVSDYSVQEERVIEFVRGFASAHSLSTTSDNGIVDSDGDAQQQNPTSRHHDLDDFGDFYVDHSSKIEFQNVLNWASKIIKGELYRAN